MMAAVTASASVLAHLLSAIFLIRSFVFIIFMCLAGMPFPVSGAFLQSASTGKVFGKNTGASGEDDFSQKPQGQTLPVETGGLRPLPLESGWLHHFLFLPFPFLGNESVRVNPASKVTEASKATPFFPLNPLMSRVEPEEKSCSRCWSVSYLFRNLRYTVSPHPLLSQRALFSLTMMCPVLHLGQVNVRAATAGRLRFRISRVALRV